MRPFLSLIVGVLGASCVFPSYEKVEPTAGGGGAGGMCESASFPGAPTDATGDGDVDQYFAIRTLDLGENHLPTRPGFDLDGSCTCCETCENEGTCTPASTSPSDYCDAIGGVSNGGRDNNLAKFFQRISALSAALNGSDDITRAAEEGEWTALIRVWNYNGQPNDDQVSVALYTTYRNPAEAGPPKWDGSDEYPIRFDALADPTDFDSPTVINHDAYVRDGVVVGIFKADQSPLTLELVGAVSLNFSYAIFTASMKESESGWKLTEGSMGGLWHAREIFTMLSKARNNGQPLLCKGQIGYDAIKDLLCTLRDGSAITGPGGCDSVSFGIAFTADPIKTPIEVIDQNIETPGCPPETDPEGDTCPD